MGSARISTSTTIYVIGSSDETAGNGHIILPLHPLNESMVSIFYDCALYSL